MPEGEAPVLQYARQTFLFAVLSLFVFMNIVPIFSEESSFDDTSAAFFSDSTPDEKIIQSTANIAKPSFKVLQTSGEKIAMIAGPGYKGKSYGNTIETSEINFHEVIPIFENLEIETIYLSPEHRNAAMQFSEEGYAVILAQ